MRREGDEDTGEITLADEDWPVPPEYRDALPPAGGTPETTHEQPPEPAPAVAPARRGLRRPPLVASTVGLALLVLVGGLVLALALRDGAPTGEASPGGSAPTSPATETAPTTTSPQTTGGEPEAVTVPRVSGLTVEAARERLSDRGLEARTREVESDLPEGQVVDQAPAAGSEAAPERAVVLAVSSGPEDVAVPDVVGLRLDRAVERLRDAGLSHTTRPSPSTRSPRTVLEQTPTAGAEVARESVIRLVVAAEPEPVEIDVPRVVGLPVAEARERLRQLGLRSTVARVQASSEPGTVVRQSPGAGTSLREGQAVRLEVSSGPALVSVPDVVGLDEAAARAELRAAGFGVQVVDGETSDPAQDGLVAAQSPGGGSSAREGAVVALTVARLR